MILIYKGFGYYLLISGEYIKFIYKCQNPNIIMSLITGNRPEVCKEVYQDIMSSKTISNTRIREAMSNMTNNNPLLTGIIEHEVKRMSGVYPDTAFTTTLLMYYALDEQAKKPDYALTENGVPIISNDVHSHIIDCSKRDEIETTIIVNHDAFFNESRYLAELMNIQVPQLPTTHPDSAYNAASFFYMLMEEQGKHDLALMVR